MPVKLLVTMRSLLSSARRIIAITLLAAAAVHADDMDDVVEFDIDAQQLDSALIQFSEQSNVQLLVATELVAELYSPGIKGRLTTVNALTSLIGSNPLSFQVVGEHTIAVSRSEPIPLAREPAADAATPSSDVNSTAAATTEITRGQPSGTLFEEYRDLLEEIVVTGVRGNPRSVADSPAPIDVISAAAMEQSGRTGVFQAIQFLVPSFHLPARAGGSTSTVIATGGLRGLNPDHTLVLINGKRRHTTSLINAVASLYNGSVPADLDHIPVAAIERIEILRDGAAAQYGSDAIAGVINIILKEKSTGGALRLTGGRNFDRNDGEYRDMSALAGFGNDDDFLTLTATYREQEASNRAIPVSADLPLYYPLPDGTPDPREYEIDRLVTRNYGTFPSRTESLSGNAGWSIDDTTALYAFGTFSHRESMLNWSFREPNSENNVLEIYPDGFRPELLIDETDFEFALGLRGEYGEWQWDLASLYGRNEAERHASNSINASLGPDSPTRFYVGELESADWTNTLDVTRPVTTTAGDLQVSWGAQHHREYYRIEPGDPASYAAGSYVFPNDHPRAGEAPAPAAQANHGITPDDASNARRDSFAGYLEFGWSPVPNVLLGLAGRYERYDDAAGDALVGKLSARFSLSDAFAVRTTASTGFRAPPLAQQQYASSTSQFRDLDGDNQLDLLLIKQLPPESPAALALGAVPLTREESINLSIGFSFEPADDFSLTVDTYRIEVNDRISITSTLSGPEVTDILVANGLSSSLSGQYYTNAIDTATTGIDIVATHTREIGSAGSLALSFGFNANETEIDRIADNPPELEALGDNFVLFDRLRRGNLTYGLPEYKAVLGVNWVFQALDANLRVVRFGDYRTTSNNPDHELKVAAESIVDLDLTYTVSDTWRVSAGANNLFNTYPAEVRPPSEDRGSGQYDTRGGFGFTGGSYYLRLEMDF